LTKLEVKIYTYISYGATVCVFVCMFITSLMQTILGKNIIVVIGFVFLGIGTVFGFAVKNDVRVLDLSRFKK
jgi:hypothetical protein